MYHIIVTLTDLVTYPGTPGHVPYHGVQTSLQTHYRILQMPVKVYKTIVSNCQ